MLIFSITKRINKALAPKLLTWSLRLHESLSSASSFPFSPNSISMLPLAQRLVSIEVQDDYRHLKLKEDGKSSGIQSTTTTTSSVTSVWDDFIEQWWNVFFEKRHQKLRAEREKEQQDQAVELEARRLWEAKQQKRQRKRSQRAKSTAKNDDDDDDDSDQNNIKGLHELSEQRVRILDEYLRPALATNGSEDENNRHLFACHRENSNPQQQQQSTNDNADYSNFVKWIRGEYLIAKYGVAVQKAVNRHPELKDDAAGLSTVEVETDDAPLKLPTVGMVREAFGMKDWNRSKVPISSWEDDYDEGGNNAITASQRDDDDDDDDLTIQQIIHNKLQGQISHSGPLNAFFEMRKREDSYELWTRDYIFGLSQYLLDRIEDMNDREQAETVILDVGAGDGRLVYFLRRAMKEISGKRAKGITNKQEQSHSLPTVIATDDGSWKAPLYNNNQIQVEQLSAFEALDKYGPVPASKEEGGAKTRLIVLCSWMPPGHDWTADFRRPIDTKGSSEDEGRSKGVERLAEEYILIGEADDGTCGHNWLTWGNPDFNTEDTDGVFGRNLDAPHVSDGYDRVDLEELSLLQFSRFDCKRSSESMTVSFRRR